MARIRLCIHGAAGRMGQRLVALASQDAGLQVVGALDSAAHPRFGEDAGLVAGIGNLGVSIGATLPDPVDVVIDFSVPAATLAIATACRARRIPLVVATTGLDQAQATAVQAVSSEIPLLRAPSMSLAVNLGMKLTAVAAQALKDHPSGADVEIIERHHRYKEDAPSGTALRFGEIIAGIMNLPQACHGREGRPGARTHGEIGYHAVRAGDNPGEHTIVFGLLGETVEVTVRATGRDCYAHGALAAARFLVGKSPGLYNMNDVLGLGAF